MFRAIVIMGVLLALSVSAAAAQPVVTNSPPPVVNNSEPVMVPMYQVPAANPAQNVPNTVQNNPDPVQQTDVTIPPAAVQQSAPAVNNPIDPVFASWQPFTGGVMMWWSDTRQIWVMTNSDRIVRVYSDIWSPGMPYPTAQPPQNFFTPIMGFGAIWSLLGGGNSQLGWAMSEHVGYDSAARRILGNEMLIQGPGDTLYAVTLPNGASVGSWRVISYG